MGLRPDPRSLDRFVRLSRTHEDGSLGLGIALVEAIAEAHGGRLLLRSAPGAGTTFTLRLPAKGGIVPKAADCEDTTVAG